MLMAPLLLINCGHDGQDEVMPPSSSSSRFEDVIEITPDSYLSVTTASSTSISGYTDCTGKMPDDRCHMTFSPETEKLSGIHITWSNQTTGQRGAASLVSFWSNDPVFGYMCKIQWFADVPLEPGENVIKLHITDPWGGYSDEFVTVTRVVDPAAVEHFIGTWLNEDPTSMPKAAIRVDAGTLYVHMWGACVPSYCDWGETTTPVSDAYDNDLSVVWNQSFAITTQSISYLSSGKLAVRSQTHFTDNSGRADYTVVYFFTRA